MPKLDPVTLSKISSAIKRANTRISRIEDTFGSNSSTFKNQIAVFEKGGLNKYTAEKSASGHWKLDKSKIMKDIRSGKLNLDQANEILRNSAGMQIKGTKKYNEAGEVTKIEYDLVESRFGGFQTRKEILEQTMEAIESGSYDLNEFEDEDGFVKLNKKTLIDITNELNAIAESFQTEYEETSLTNEQIKSDEVLSDLFNEDHGGTRNKRQLTYDELQRMAARFKEIKDSLQQEKESGAKNSDYLTNKPGE